LSRDLANNKRSTDRVAVGAAWFSSKFDLGRLLNPLMLPANRMLLKEAIHALVNQEGS
jgi:hypothetical protein